MKNISQILIAVFTLVIIQNCTTTDKHGPKTITGNIKANVVASSGTNFNFPEQTPEFLSATSNCGICFSGGGTRSLSASMGQMRGLEQLGILTNARYISCVSGGSWASAVFTYYKSGASDDRELLGVDPTLEERKTWKLSNWNSSLKHSNLAYPATVDFEKTLGDYILKGPEEMAWIYAVRDTFFKPFGLDDNNFFSLDNSTVADILNENKALQPDWDSSDFDLPREERPYLIVNGTLLWPIELEDLGKVYRVLVQFTPLYVGNPFALTLKAKDDWVVKDQLLNTGGGVLDTFAFGSSGPEAAPGSWLEMPGPSEAFTIWHASGISSAAYGFDEAKTDIRLLLPRENYWAVTDSEKSLSVSENQCFSDGGNLENFGIMAMLQRQVKKIIVFVNSGTALKKDEEGITIDSDVAPLFGLANSKFSNNRVFDSGGYTTLTNKLWDAYSNGGLAMAKESYTTIPNVWFGIPEYEVEVLWVYNAPVQDWIKQLSTKVQRAVKSGIKGEQPLKDFPNYKTVGENWLQLIKLYPEQVSLIADMFSWSIQQNSTKFEEFLAPVQKK
ncbi:MAG: hypothetical protein HON76_00485 [Candidatus Scalindua sp.]|nr:hypothetical protein [Candidatus Scalindua sp.]MBT5304735.1 hypothetical protein [Candidatus Scalindua sp.]MBT6049534.1 hypothetical protein [Candidatus Scalindua sp.]MBT6228143.1 hypothetical protein [Candidatus Scalindua sp.]MBT6560989.1 hypothetical protein [Candidatus Scalindua sp.]